MTMRMNRIWCAVSAALLFLSACAPEPAPELNVMTFNMRYDNPEDGENNWRFRRERVARALLSLGSGELENILAEQGEAELTCQFCDKVYRYTKEELEELLAGME